MDKQADSYQELLTAEWLQSVGFRKSWMADRNRPHWLLWCADTRAFMGGSDDLGVELDGPDTPPHWEENKTPKWWCWLRSDFSHSRGRFCFVRYMRTRADVANLVMAITGEPWTPSRHEHGCVRYPGQKLESDQAVAAVDPVNRGSSE
jgi:hypothetical protein